MAVLARDLDAYQRAVEQYQRSAKSYNHAGNLYQDSLVKDASGNVYVINAAGQAYTAPPGGGQLTKATLPSGSNYRYSAMPEDPDYQAVQYMNPDGSAPANPGEFTKTMPTNKPDFTLAQARKLGEPSLAQAEAGLIGSVFK